MKKALVHKSAPRQTRLRLTKTLKVIGGLALLALVAGIGLAGSRPAHTAGGPIPVTVSNVPLQTISQNASDPALQSIQFLAQPDTFGKGSLQAEVDIPVPTGKRFVIEYVSAELGTGTGSVTMETSSGGNLAAYYFIETTSSHQHQFFPTHIYADPGTNVAVFVNSANGSRVYADVEISGHYVNLP